MNTALKGKLYNITFTLHDLTHKPIPYLYFEIKNGKELVKKGRTNLQGEISLKYVGGNSLTVFVRKDHDQTMKKIGVIHTPNKNIRVKLISPKMKFDVTLLPHKEQGKYWRGTYKVKSGDTLSKIAKEHNTTVSALLALNPSIKSPNSIYKDEQIALGESNADAVIKLTSDSTIKIPPSKKTGTVIDDRKSKSLSPADIKADIAESKTEKAQKIETKSHQAQSSKQNASAPQAAQLPARNPPQQITSQTAAQQKIDVQQEHNDKKQPVAVAGLSGCVCKDYDLIWSGKVDCLFRKKVVEIAKELWGENDKIEKANMLMAVFSWESGGTFATDVPNMRNSGGTGLIQIMPDTYKSLTKNNPTLIKTSKYYNQSLTIIKELATMTQLQYLEIVKRYFFPLKGENVEFVDFYLQVLYPASSGKNEHSVFAKNVSLLDVNDHKVERVNKFDRNNMDGFYLDKQGRLQKDGKKDGRVMKSEIAAAIESYRSDGAKAENKSNYKEGCSLRQNNISDKHKCITGSVIDGFIIDERVKVYKVPSYNKLLIGKVKAIVLHRTAGAPNVRSYLDSMMKSSSTVGVQFWIGKDGVIYQAGGLDKLSHHIDKAPLSNPKIPNLWSKNTIGIEVSGYYFRGLGSKHIQIIW
ncbi:MAG: LysM peptidoglycan-binding domain-containing protein [Acinetobacter sp.]